MVTPARGMHASKEGFLTAGGQTDAQLAAAAGLSHLSQLAGLSSYGSARPSSMGHK